MRTFLGVWVWFAFSILGFTFFSKTDFFTGTQDFESNFEITNHPETFLPYWSANEIRSTAARVFQAKGEGINLSNALGIQVISTFNAEIFIHTSTQGMENPSITFQAKTNQNGSGNRPVNLYYSLSGSLEGPFSQPLQIGDESTFPNQNTEYKEFSVKLTQEFLNVENLWVKLEAKYGNGSGTAARLFIDDFTIHEAGDGNEPPKEDEDGEKALELLEVKIISAHALELTFSKADLPDRAQEYLLSNNYGNPSQVEITGEVARLVFESYLFPNAYTLNVNQADSLVSFEFDLQTPIPQGAILINEFMADPNPKSQAPPQPTFPTGSTDEFIELYNPTAHDISLEGVTYNNRSLEKAQISANSYALLVPMGKKETFEPFGTVVGVNSFQALPNSSGQIVLKDKFGNMVDSLSYDLTWYGNTPKSNGGWSLERINPFLNCSDKENWTASIDPRGASPGVINSVYNLHIDQEAFTLIDHAFQGDSAILLAFSQPILDITTATFKLDGQAASFQVQGKNSIQVMPPFKLENGKSYELSISNLKDCNMRSLKNGNLKLLFDTTAPSLKRISPINPTTLNLVFDKKLGSVSKSSFLIQNSQPVQVSALDTSRVQLVLAAPLEIGKKETLEIKDISDTRGNVRTSQLYEFIFEDLTDSVKIKSPFSLSIHFHKPIDPKSILPENFWVDRNTGHPVAAFPDDGDSRVVHLVFDKSLPQNNLTWLQIENLKEESGKYIYTLSRSFTRDMRAISVSQILVPNDSVLQLSFNKPLLQNKAEIVSNYTVDNSILNAASAIQKSPMQVDLIFNRKFIEGKEYRLSIIGLEDVHGVIMARTVNNTFVYDLSPPRITEHSLISPFELTLEFNKSIQPFSTEQVILAGNKPLEIYQEKPNQFTVIFDNPIKSHAQLELWEIVDLLDNTAEYISLDLGENPLELGRVEIMDPNSVQLTFTDYLDPKTSIFTDRFTVQGAHPSQASLEENGYQLTLELKTELGLGDSVEVVADDIKTINEKHFRTLGRKVLYDDGVDHIDIQTANSLIIQHHVSASPIDNSRFVLEETDISIQAFRNQSVPELTHLILSKPLENNQTYSLLLPRRQMDSRNYLPGSRRQLVFDRTPPKIVSVEAYLENEVLVTFDENLDPIMAMVANHYKVNQTSPEQVILMESSNQVILQFGFDLVDGKPYELFVHRLEDLFGNAIVEEFFTFTFEKPHAPGFKEIVINEIMAAPKEGQKLPNAEYIELYNTGAHPVQLGGFRLANSRNATVLPRFELEPESYVILCAQSQAGNFKPYGPTLGLSNWPALLNGGDEVKILNRSGNVLDSLEYQTSSYGGNEFAQGGYSLEVVNPFQSCNTTGNLRPSSSPNRGTPGRQNAVFDTTPDRISPEVVSLTLSDSVSILVSFSKPMQEKLGEQYFSIAGKNVQSVAYLNALRTEVVLKLSTALEKNTHYTLKINNLRDCLGNSLHPDSETHTLILPGEAEMGDLIINEVLFNPLTGSPKFVEIFNTSNKYLNLKNWKLSNFANEEVSNRRVISSTDLILAPRAYLAITTDAKQLLQVYPKGERLHEMPSLPSYPIREGTVILLDPEENLIERLDYSEMMHNPLLKEVKGVSLERLTPSGDVNNAENWQSASGNAGWATPGYKNSQILESTTSESRFSISPEIFAPDAVGTQPFTSIHYHLDEPGYLASIQILGINGLLVKEITQNQILGQNGFYIWNGTNENGVKQRPGYYIIWIQLTHPKGRVEQIRKTVAIGSKLR